MREKYWDFFTDIKFKECYFEFYRARSVFLDKAFVFAGLVLSTSGLAAFFAQMGFSTAGAALIVLGQLLTVISHLLPYAQRVQALNYFLQEIPKLLDQIETDWHKIELDRHTDEEIALMLEKHATEYTALEVRFLGSLSLPRSPRISEKAFAEIQAFFESRYCFSAEAESSLA
jgi:hypothetical protein